MIDSFRNKIKNSNEEICSDVCKYLKSIGKDHIVMENLDNGFGDKNNRPEATSEGAKLLGDIFINKRLKLAIDPMTDKLTIDF